ncbi:FUSC family protein [Streptomyces pseudogriseolus]|uniref:FUSC family protein n=1 Tax=Streptomyces pseudogriseolus TaxID=36817 RepID=UPI003FA1C42C
MADEVRESEGYAIPPETKRSLDAAARDYSYEVFVKARLIADGRNSDTVTPEDVSLAVKTISDADSAEYVRISKRSLKRALAATAGVTIGTLAAYFIAQISPGRLDTAATIAALLSATGSVAAASLTWRTASRVHTEITLPTQSEEERKMLLVQAWANIEGQMYEELEKRSEGQASRTLPLRSLIENHEKINSLGPEFRGSLSHLIEARNRIVHGLPYDLSEERYRSLMDTVRKVSRAVSSPSRDDNENSPGA